VTTTEHTPRAESDDLDDVLLMRLIDGDLDPTEKTEVRSRLEASPAAERKLASLLAVGEALRAEALRAETDNADPRIDAIADAVMASLADEPHDSEEADTRQKRRTQHRHEATAANDNARSIFAVAGLATAAAAALFVWGRSETAELDLVKAPVPEAPLVAEMSAGLAVPAPAASESSGLAPGETGVEVASVEFGSEQGSVFYVPGDGAATAVVWINDSGDEP
jgi:anti-sigma factor RsiW